MDSLRVASARAAARGSGSGALHRVVPAFVELAIDNSAAPASPQCSAAIEIALPRGLAVRVSPGFDAGTLRRVVDALVA